MKAVFKTYKAELADKQKDFATEVPPSLVGSTGNCELALLLQKEKALTTT